MAALQQIVTEMGATYWKFNGDQCEIEMVGITPTPPTASEGYVDCNCNFNNNTVCHITNLYGFSLSSFRRVHVFSFVDIKANTISSHNICPCIFIVLF